MCDLLFCMWNKYHLLTRLSFPLCVFLPPCQRPDDYVYEMCLVIQSCLILCNSMNCSLPSFSVHGDSPGKNIGVDWHALLQGIFPSQRSNPGLLFCRWILYHLSHQGSLNHCRGQPIPSQGYIPDEVIKLSGSVVSDSLRPHVL